MNIEPIDQNENSSSGESLDDFEGYIESIQSDLRGYIISISGHGGDAEDILQETNIFIWQRKEDFQLGTSFKAWAFKVAYFKAMASRRDQVRRGEVVLSETITQRIASEAASHYGKKTDKVDALKVCLQQLRPEEQHILQVKYLDRVSLTEFAVQIGKSVDAVHKTVSRVRQGLRACINQRISGGK